MKSKNDDLIDLVASNALRYLSDQDPENLKASESVLLDQAISLWVDIAAEINPSRPSRDEIREYLIDVVNNVVSEIIKSKDAATIITLSYVTGRLVEYLVVNLDWRQIDPFILPLEILSAVIYASAIKKLKKQL
jgi:hypothetical protein